MLDTIIEETNTFLDWLFIVRDPDWEQSLGNVMIGHELAKAKLAAKKATTKAYGPDAFPMGALEYNLNEAIKRCFTFILPSHAQMISQILKDRAKVIQFGRGAGKATVVLSTTKFFDDSALSHTLIDPRNPSTLSRLATNYEDDVDALTNEIVRLKATLAEKETQNKSLIDQVSNRHRLTWV